MAQKRSFLLRLPPDLWEHLKRWADEDLRSVNAQIEWLLRDALRRRGRLSESGPPPASAPRSAEDSPTPFEKGGSG